MKTSCFSSFSLGFVTIISLAAVGVAEDVHLALLSKGAMTKLGGYNPQRVALTNEKPAALQKAPADLSAPLYGKVTIGPKESPASVLLIVDEPDGKPARLFVDANANADLTDDPAAEWTAKTSKAQNGVESTTYSGGAMVNVTYGKESHPFHVAMYRFDKNDPARASLKTTLLYYRDYAYEGNVTVGGKAYKAMLTDDFATGDFRGKAGETLSGVRLLVDVNGNGKFEARGETFDVRKPFNLAGTTYELANVEASGRSFQIVKSSQTVEEVAAAPNFAVGQKALPFARKSTDGKDIQFPQSYKGKLVMLDFWAIWCGPCRAELPNLTAAYEKYHGQGFEVLGISLDQANAAEKLRAFTKENKMPWPQIYDGKFWSAEVAQQYGVDSIPRCLLVDGDTGLIVATTEQLRGAALSPTLEKALAKKTAK